MIQFNLLPDVKQEFIRSRQLKRMVVLLAIIISALALTIFVLLLLIVHVFQKQHIKDQNEDIKKYSSQLQNTPDLDKILTIQNQLNSLSGLHDKKVVTSRVFSYTTQLTPAQASISKLSIDFTSNTMSINGSANSIETVNKFVDTLKFTTYSTGDGSEEKKAFSDVLAVLQLLGWHSDRMYIETFYFKNRNKLYEGNFAFILL